MLSVTEGELTAKQCRRSMLHHAGDDSHMCRSGSAGPGDVCQASKSCLSAATRGAQHTGQMVQFSASGKQPTNQQRGGWGENRENKPQIKARFAERRKVLEYVRICFDNPFARQE